MKEILAIGGYERDNFGDLLFLKVLQKFSEGKANITPSSIIYSDMTDSLGEIVVPYDVALATKQFDAVWVVGGEIGGAEGLSFYSGLAMDFQAEAHSTYNAAQDKSFIVHTMSSLSEDSDQAYLPNLKNYPINKDTKVILNSVGIGGYDKIADKKVKKTTLEILRKSRISVRDDRSSGWLTLNGIEHTVSPDVVHVLPSYYPKKKTNDEYIVFQANAEYLQRKSIDTVVKMLIDVARDSRMKIILFVAGMATGHDSMEYYRAIQRTFLKRFPEGSIEVMAEEGRDPIDLSQVIANAKLTIATSLHVRILSVAYGVPRVSLVLDAAGKIAIYCRRWDDGHPVNSDLNTILDDIHKTVATTGQQRLEESRTTSDLAYTNLEKTFSSIRVGKNTGHVETNLLNETVKKYFNGIMHMQAIINQRDKHLHEKDMTITSLYEEVDALHKTIENIEKSHAYRIGSGIAKPYRSIKGNVQRNKQ